MGVKLYTDGACRGNPGNGACAWYLVNHNKLAIDAVPMFKTAVYIGHCTNNVAEYCAVLYGLLSLVPSDIKDKPLTIVSDSELIIKQLLGTYQCNKPELHFYKTQILTLIHTHFTSVSFEHTPRTNNFIMTCDKLCNELLDNLKGETKCMDQ